MTQDRLFRIWLDITWAGLPTLVVLSILLDWAPVLQIFFTTLAASAVFGTQFALSVRRR